MEQFNVVSFFGSSGVVSYNEKDSFQRTEDGQATGLYVLGQTDPLSVFSNNATMISIFRSDSGWEDVLGRSLLNEVGGFRVDTDPNYLSGGVRIFGVILAMIVLLFAIFEFLVLWSRTTARVRTTPPVHAYCIIFGSSIASLSMITQSFDEGVVWASEHLNVACLASLWTFWIGHTVVVVTYASFLYRTDLDRRKTEKILQKENAEALPGICLMLTVIILLLVWTLTDPLLWIRRDISEVPVETFGACRSENGPLFFSAIIAIIILAHIFAVKMGYRNMKASSETESIIQASCLNIQAWCFGLPMFSLVGTESTEGNYLVRCIMVWVLSLTGLVCVVGPLVYKRLKHRLFPQTMYEDSSRFKFGDSIMFGESMSRKR